MAVAVAMAVAVTVRDRGRCRSGEIYQSIEALDQRGMALIEAQDPMSFAAYQREFGNTICGQHPIAVLLQMLHRDKEKHALKFVRYAQSSRCSPAAAPTSRSRSTSQPSCSVSGAAAEAPAAAPEARVAVGGAAGQTASMPSAAPLATCTLQGLRLRLRCIHASDAHGCSQTSQSTSGRQRLRVAAVHS